MFRSYKHLVESKTESRFVPNPGPAPRVPIWEVARAATAAPTVFKTMKIGNLEFLDASFLGAQNPILMAFDEVSQMHRSTQDSVTLAVSIGSGNSRFNQRLFEERGKFLNILRQRDGAAEAHDQMLRLERQLRGTRREILYERFDVESGLQRIGLDQWKMKKPLLGSKAHVNLTLVKIRSATEAYLAQPAVQERLRVVAERLVKNRRERAQDVAKWKVVVGID
jgi:hypothetical protein